VGGELVDDGARHGDRSPSGLCLRRAKLDVSLGFGQRLLNRQDPAREVWVLGGLTDLALAPSFGGLR
jgi:hypothetical protein